MERTAGRILVTGFGAFGEHGDNPSEAVVRALEADGTVATAILPVAFEEVGDVLDAVLLRAQPSAVLMLGLHGDRRDPGLRLEWCARNEDDCDAVDNRGERRRGLPIRTGGPAVHPSTLPLDAFATALDQLDVPYRESDDAGGFLCNHAFYRAQERLVREGVPCGFVHLPSSEQLSLERQRRAVDRCLEVLSRGLSGSPRVQFAHGLEGSPRGTKAQRLGEAFVSATPAMDTRRLDSCVETHARVLERFRPDVLVGSSFGGAVVARLLAKGLHRGPTVLLAQAALRLDPACRLPGDVPITLVHGTRDDVVPIEDSRALAARSGSDRVRLVELDDDHALHRSCRDGTLLGLIAEAAAG